MIGDLEGLIVEEAVGEVVAVLWWLLFFLKL